MSIKYFYRVLFALLIILQAVFADSSKEFTNQVLSLIDERENAYLFRGKNPECDGSFAYDALRDQIKTYLSEAGKQISNDFKLICVSLLNPFEIREWHIEKKWFLKNRNKGYLQRHPLFGSFFNPSRIAMPCRKIFYAFDPDRLQILIPKLKKLLDNGSAEQSGCVIYLHCYAGKDRTGEAASCYLMHYKGYSYSDVVNISKQIAKRKLRSLSLNAIKWYAYYLLDVHHLPTIGDINDFIS